MALTKPSNRPRHKLPNSKKTEQWFKDQIDWADSQIFRESNSIRKSIKQKLVNYRLWMGKVNSSDMESLMRSHTMDFTFKADKIQHYPIVVPHINVLLGEEIGRNTEYTVIITNSDAISEMEERKKEAVLQKLMMLINSNYSEEEQLNAAYEKLAHYFKFSYQDILEHRGNLLLRHYYKELGVKHKHTEGFFNNLTVAEEIYQSDIVNNEPIFKTLNPLKSYMLLPGDSNLIEDCELFIYEDYWSFSQIQDYFHEDLKESQVEKLEKLSNGGGEYSENGEYDPTSSYKFIGEDGEFILDDDSTEGLIGYAAMSGFKSGSTMDLDGNFRVLMVFFKTKERIKKVRFIDPISGDTYTDLMPDSYIPNTDLGEEVIGTYWINKAMEGYKIADDIHVRLRARRLQYNRISNPSKCHFGISGVVCTYNQLKATSLLDRLKPYQYFYDIIMDRVNDALAKDIGAAYELDVAKLPAGMDEIDWFYFLIRNKIALVDSFKEGESGAATGKLAGSFNTMGKPLNMSQAPYIEYNLKLLEFVKMEMAYISGITPQRMGSTNSNETFGGVERSIRQSSYITEPYYEFHKIAVKNSLQILLDTATFALKNNPKKFRYIADDISAASFEVDSEDLSSLDLGVIVEDSQDSSKFKQIMEGLAQAALQNQLTSLSGIAKMYKATSLASMEKILETEEEKAGQRAAAREQEMIQSQERMAAKAEAIEKDRLDREDLNKEKDRELKYFELIETRNKIRDTDYTSNSEEINLKRTKLRQDLDKLVKDYTINKDKLKETIRHNKATESISRIKSNRS